MEELSRGMKSHLRKNIDWLDQIITGVVNGQIDIVYGIEQIDKYVMKNIENDFQIIDPKIWKIFVEKKKELEVQDKKNKDEFKAGIRFPEDSLDDWNLKRSILRNFDLEKYRRLLIYALEIAQEHGWLE